MGERIIRGVKRSRRGQEEREGEGRDGVGGAAIGAVGRRSGEGV